MYAQTFATARHFKPNASIDKQINLAICTPFWRDLGIRNAHLLTEGLPRLDDVQRAFSFSSKILKYASILLLIFYLGVLPAFVLIPVKMTLKHFQAWVSAHVRGCYLTECIDSESNHFHFMLPKKKTRVEDFIMINGTFFKVWLYLSNLASSSLSLCWWHYLRSLEYDGWIAP